MIFRTHKNTRKNVFRIIGSFIFAIVAIITIDILFRTHAISESNSPGSYMEYYQEIVADNKVVALTFDDGPHPKTSLEIVRILKEYDVPATFFFLGLNTLKYPHIARNVHEEGFEIGNHTFTHSWDVHSTPSRLEFELNATNNILKNVTGESPVLYRPPFLLDIGGDPSFDVQDKKASLELATKMGYVVVGADVDSNDWKAQSADEVVVRLLADIETRKGHIVLLHDGFSGRYTVEALPVVIRELRMRGYEFTTVSNILGLHVVKPNSKPSFFAGFILDIKSYTSYLFVYIVAVLNNILRFFITLTLWLFIFRFVFISFLFIIKLFSKLRKKNNKVFDGGVSIIIPVHNEAENITETVRSVLDNNYRNIEIIIVDDGSTDNTALIGGWIQNNYPRSISLIKIQNGGKANALNVGIRAAMHEIVIGMDGDTVFDKDAIRHLVRHFIDPEVSGVAGKVCVLNPKNILSAFQEIEYVVAQNIDKVAFNVINAIGVIPGAIGAWRKSDVLLFGGYSTDTLAEDQDLTLALLANGKRVIYEPEAISYTEAPYTVKDFIKQRFRWIFGTIQCLWKYKKKFFSVRIPSLGFVVLPNTLIYTIFLSLLYPFFDLLFIAFIFLGSFKQILFIYFFFTLIDLLYAGSAYIYEKRKWILLLIPFQRIFYRFIIYIVILKCIVKIIEGTEVVWGKVNRKNEYHLENSFGLLAYASKAFKW